MSGQASLGTSSDVRHALGRLIEAGELAVLLLNDVLVVVETHGALAAAVPLNVPVDEGLPYLAGLAPDLLNMQDEPDASFLLSNVGIAGAEKVNIEAFWQPDDRRYCLLIHKLGLRTAPEAEIVKQIKSRRIAEQHLQQTRQELGEQQAIISALVEAAPIALAITNRDMRYLIATRAWHTLFDLGPANLTARPLAGEPIVQQVFPSGSLDRALAGQAPPAIDISIAVAAGQRTFRAGITPWRRGEGPVQGLILTAAVDDALVERSLSLTREAERLSQTNTALEEIIAIAAHDLEAPRRAIDRALESAGPLPRDEIAAHSAQLGSLLRDLLEHARLAGTTAEPQPVDIAAVARSALNTAAHEDQFGLDCWPAALEVRALRLPLETIVRNLIANAIRHHDRGHGTIELRLEGIGPNWRLTIADDGPGIAEADRERIFEAFRQTDAGLSKGGAGLGLALVAAAASRMGGSITAGPRPDGKRGAHFTLDWPKVSEELR